MLVSLLDLVASLEPGIADPVLRNTTLRKRVAQAGLEEGLRTFLASAAHKKLRPVRLFFPAAIAATLLGVREGDWVSAALNAIPRRLRTLLIEELVSLQSSEAAALTLAVVEELAAATPGRGGDPEADARMVGWLSWLRPDGPTVGEHLLAIAEDASRESHVRATAAALLDVPVLQAESGSRRLKLPQGVDPAELDQFRTSLLGNRPWTLAAAMADDRTAETSDAKGRQKKEFRRVPNRTNAEGLKTAEVSPVDQDAGGIPQGEDAFDAEICRLVARGSEGQSYADVASGLDRVREVVARAVAQRLEEAIRAELPNRRFSSYEDKKDVAHWLNEELRRFDLSIKSPTNGQPARLKVAAGRAGSGGFIQIVTDLGDGHWNTTNCSTIPDLVESIALVSAPPRREGLKEWRDRVREDPKTTQLGE